MTGQLAFVESPVQLLNVLEWAHTRAPGTGIGTAPGTGAPATDTGTGTGFGTGAPAADTAPGAGTPAPGSPAPATAPGTTPAPRTVVGL
ncbi:hypothetical protein [Streptomyces sp. WAC02707]|uniref:hypothetical protein n=1 Tax=Streptomyces sp. WAC02707 TaxID=2487417 RepID=UPI00163C8637